MGDLTKNFSKSELTCKCGCGLFIENAALTSLLQKIRDSVNKPLTVSSGLRCQRHNASVGGVVAVKYYKPGTKTLDLDKYPRGVRGRAKDSNHTHGTAADIACAGMTANALWVLIKLLYSKERIPELAGLGRYDTFCHVDVDPKVSGRLREWDERKKR